MTWHAKETLRGLYDIEDPADAEAFIDELIGDMSDTGMPPEVQPLGGTPATLARPDRRVAPLHGDQRPDRGG